MINSIISARHALGVNVTPAPSRFGSSAPAEAKAATDTVSISNEARCLLLASPFSSTGSTTISAKDIEESLADTKSYVEKQLQALYSDLGIPSNSNLEISFGPDGRILVNGDSPASETLAEAINADDELSNSLRKMSADTSLLEAMKNHEEFASAYEKSPASAIERYGYLLESGHSYHVSFSMQDGHIDTKVEYV